MIVVQEGQKKGRTYLDYEVHLSALVILIDDVLALCIKVQLQAGDDGLQHLWMPALHRFGTEYNTSFIPALSLRWGNVTVLTPYNGSTNTGNDVRSLR